MKRYLVGVDEAGRGPLAGPVSVGVAIVPLGFDWAVIPDVNDSKKLSEKKREEIFLKAQSLKKQGQLNYVVIMVPAKTIDTIGITASVKKGIFEAFRKLNPHPKYSEIKLDGLLTAPEEFLLQETIIKGDAKEKIIGLASIMAKVTRDRYMVRQAVLYEQYGFDIHKGYGTKKHREAIKRHGLSDMHRKTFCTKLSTQ